MPASPFTSPIVQVAIDVLRVDDALRIAESAVTAGVDWLEVGTPLITFAGTSAIGALAREFPHMPILADFKCMDGARKYVQETKSQGGRLATVCAQAADETIKAAVEAGTETGIAVVCDLINSLNVAKRAMEVEAIGVDSVFIHWGADQRAANPSRDPQRDLESVLASVQIPVGIATFHADEGAKAVRVGAQIAVIGFPVIGEPDVQAALRKYVDTVKAV